MTLPPHEALKTTAVGLKRLAKVVEALANACNAPIGGAPSAAKVAAAWAAYEKVPTPDTSMLPDVGAWLVAEKAGRKDRLSAALRAGCEARGLDLVVVTRDPLELRINPLGVSIDVEKNRASIHFGRLELASCDADADGILLTRAKALAAIDGAWNAASFHETLRRAWLRASPAGEWAELAAVLPELVFLMQPATFRADPSPKKFVPYSRAQLCFDLWRLRRDRALAKDGWRLTVAPATGTSTKDKSRVYWLEDDRGQGQWHLTMRMVREEPV